MKRALLSLPLLPALLLSGCAVQAPSDAAPTPPVAAPSPPAVEIPADGRPLTGEEIARVNEAFLSHTERDGVTYATPVSGFFTSYYNDVRELSFPDFLRYFPGNGVLGADDQAEYDALAALPGFPWINASTDMAWPTAGDLPVPVHRIPRASVDAALERYAGITSADLADTSGVLWLEEYDAWYTFASDFGPGTFECTGGQVDEEAGAALLWTDTRGDGTRVDLLLGRDGEDWHIRALCPSAPDPDTELLDVLRNEYDFNTLGSVSWTGPGPSPGADRVWRLLNEAARSGPADPPEREEAVWSLDCAFAPRTQGSYGEDDVLHLYAGLAENLVQVVGVETDREWHLTLEGYVPHVPGSVWLESGELYQLLRTSCDSEAVINETYYEKYRDLVDGYYDTRLEEVRDRGYVSWELTEFAGVLGTTRVDGKGATAFRMGAAFRTDPPELALQRLAGGAYVDSQLRVHGLDWQNIYLVTLDDDPIGIAFGEDVIDYIEGHWGEEVDPAELAAVVDASSRSG